MGVWSIPNMVATWSCITRAGLVLQLCDDCMRFSPFLYSFVCRTQSQAWLRNCSHTSSHQASHHILSLTFSFPWRAYHLTGEKRSSSRFQYMRHYNLGPLENPTANHFKSPCQKDLPAEHWIYISRQEDQDWKVVATAKKLPDNDFAQVYPLTTKDCWQKHGHRRKWDPWDEEFCVARVHWQIRQQPQSLLTKT